MESGDVADLSDLAEVESLRAATHARDGTAERAGGRGRRRALIAMLVGITAIFSNIYATQPILPILGHEFDVPPAASGLTVSVVVMGMGLASLLYGPLSDRIGRRPVILVSGALVLLPTLGVAVAPTFGILLACRALQGLLIPGTTAVGLVYLQEILPASWRGFGTSAYVSATALGGLIGRLQGGFMAEAASWRWAFGSFLLSSTLGLLLMIFWLPPEPQLPLHGAYPEEGSSAPHVTARWVSEMARIYLGLFAFFRQRRIFGGALIGFTLFFAFISVFTYIPYRMEAPPFDLTQGEISLLYLVYLIGFVVTPFTGRLSDRYGRRAVIGGSMLFMVAGLLCARTEALAAIVLGLGLLNIGLLAAHAAASAFVSDNAKSGRGSATSFYLVWYYLGGTFGPVVTGLAWQSAGWTGVLTACAISIVLALIVLLTLCA